MIQKFFKYLKEDNEAYINDNWFNVKSKYDLKRHNDELLFVDIDTLLKIHSEDQPNYDILKKENQIGNRVEKAKEFIKNYINDDRIIIPKTGKRTNIKVRFEPSIVYIFNDKLSFEDGRHRVLAAKEMGLKKVAIEISKDQIDLFKALISKNKKRSMSQNPNWIKPGYGFKVKELKNKIVKVSSKEETKKDEVMSPIYPNMTEKDADNIYFEIQKYIKEFPEEEKLQIIKDEFESGINKAAGIKYWYKKLYDVFNKRESLKYIKGYKSFK